MLCMPSGNLQTPDMLNRLKSVQWRLVFNADTDIRHFTQVSADTAMWQY